MAHGAMSSLYSLRWLIHAEACIAMQMSRVSGAARAASCLQPLIFIFTFLQCTIIYTPFQVTARLCPNSLQLCKEAHNFTSSLIGYKVSVEPAAASSGRPSATLPAACWQSTRRHPQQPCQEGCYALSSATQPIVVASSSQLLCLRSCPAATPLPVLTA